MNKSDYIWMDYHFDFIDKDKEFDFTILLDKKTFVALPPEGCKEEYWTKLDYKQCNNCPLNSEDVRNCPIAYNISGLIDIFKNNSSTEKVVTAVEVEQRIYKNTVSMQQGLRSILGIYLAASGCPHMNILKPMARFHLPFASFEETVYRHIGNFFIKEYFKKINGEKREINLDELEHEYKKIYEVNVGMCNRIEEIFAGDANKNALIILNTIGTMVDLELKNQFRTLKPLFE